MSTVGLRKEKELFLLGYQEMMRKIDPSAIICYGKPFDEMKGRIVAVDYNATNNRSKGFYVHKTYRSNTPLMYPVLLGMGNAGAPRIPTVNIGDLPANVQRAYYGYDSVGWKGTYPGQAEHTGAGGKFRNEERLLPATDENGEELGYRKYDINNKIPGQDRDKERFVRDNNGRVYYSSNHYDGYVEVIGG